MTDMSQSAISFGGREAAPSPNRQDAGRDRLAQAWLHAQMVPAAIDHSE
jgi:hypothetical protein